MGHRLKKGRQPGRYACGGHAHVFEKGKSYELSAAQQAAFADVVEADVAIKKKPKARKESK